MTLDLLFERVSLHGVSLLWHLNTAEYKAFGGHSSVFHFRPMEECLNNSQWSVELYKSFYSFFLTLFSKPNMVVPTLAPGRQRPDLSKFEARLDY